MRDPNYPENQDYSPAVFKSAHTQLPPPQNRELHHEVYDRITKLRAMDDKLIEDNKAKNVYKARTMRYTDWSQPSAPVRFILPSEAFAGEVLSNGDRIAAKMVVTQLSGNAKFPGAVLATEVVAERGMVVGAEAGRNSVDIIAPTDKLVKKLESQPVLPRQVVVDIRGGIKLAGDSKDDTLLSTGEVMLLRPDNSIIISNNLDDQFLYRLYTFQDDIEASKRATNQGGMAGGEGGMGSGGPGSPGGY